MRTLCQKKKQGFLIEVVDKHTGVYQHGLVVDVRDASGGWFDERWADVFGDFALVRSEHESTAVYRLSTRQRIGEVFGQALAADANVGLFCARDRKNDVVIYDAASVRERKRFTYATPVRFAQFLPARKQLYVLTADQKVHIISLDEPQVKAAP